MVPAYPRPSLCALDFARETKKRLKEDWRCAGVMSFGKTRRESVC
jgi:hypothetical protein